MSLSEVGAGGDTACTDPNMQKSTCSTRDRSLGSGAQMGWLGERAFLSYNLVSIALIPVVVRTIKSIFAEGNPGVVVSSSPFVLFNGFWFAFQESLSEI